MKKASPNKTIAIVDIENGSVGVSLVQFSPAAAPRIFTQNRTHFSPLEAVHGEGLLQRVTRVVEEGFNQISKVAARIRVHPTLNTAGTIEKSMIFLGVPWSEIHSLSPHHYRATAPRTLTTELQKTANGYLGDIPISFHALGPAIARTITPFYPQDTNIVCIIQAEVTELLVLAGTTLIGHATFPMGFHTVLRTLMSHSGMSLHETRPALLLQPSYLSEPLTAAQTHFIELLTPTLHQFAQSVPLQNLIIIAHDPYAEWFAHAVAASEQIASLYQGKGTVRALRPAQLTELINHATAHPDVFLALETLFADKEHHV